MNDRDDRIQQFRKRLAQPAVVARSWKPRLTKLLAVGTASVGLIGSAVAYYTTFAVVDDISVIINYTPILTVYGDGVKSNGAFSLSIVNRGTRTAIVNQIRMIRALEEPDAGTLDERFHETSHMER